MKKYLIIAFTIAITSCGVKKTSVTEESATETVLASEIIKNHYKLNRNFTTAYIKAGVKYKDDKQSPPNASAEIKIEKNKQILVSIRFMGITMAKAHITPSAVKYYEKLGGKYFEGDYSTLSKWLGTDLDFLKVQNMLIGEAMDDLSKGKYKTTLEDKLYKLETVEKNTEKSFFFEAANYLIKKQEIKQANQNRMLWVSYPSHQDYSQAILPTEIKIEASQKGKKTNIDIQYNTINFNENLSFPYSVPEGYERIYID